MPRKKNAQKAKEFRRRLSDIMALILLFIIFLFFLSYTIRNTIICNNIKTEKLIQYSGGFEIQKVHRTRNVIYFIYLENGDVIRADQDLLKTHCDFTQFSSLSFTYSAPKFGLKSAYTCVEITDLSGAEFYLNSDRSLKEATGCIYLGTFFSVLLAAVIILLIYILVPQKVH